MDRALHVGRAAEHLVVADLLMQGYDACLTEQGMPYDVIVDAAGRIIRVQVKATMGPRNVNAAGRGERIAYSWSVRRRGKGGHGRLDTSHCDLVALVALDIRTVAYLPVAICGETVQLDHDQGTQVRGRDGYGWARTVGQFPIGDAIDGDPALYKAKRRETCPRGHPLSAENLIKNGKGQSTCKICSNARSIEYQRAKRETAT